MPIFPNCGATDYFTIELSIAEFSTTYSRHIVRAFLRTRLQESSTLDSRLDNSTD